MNALGTSEDSGDGYVKMIDSHVAQLSEHFDSVQVFCTQRTGDGNTRVFSRGGGNYYANYGAAREWIVRQDERTRVDERCDD